MLSLATTCGILIVSYAILYVSQPSWRASLFPFSDHSWLARKLTPDSLDAIPGPFYSRYTRLVLKYHILKGTRMHYVHALHGEYGPTVRLAPNEVATLDAQALKQIYSVGNAFSKARSYDDVIPSGQWRGERPLFAVKDPKVASERRSKYSRKFKGVCLAKALEEVILPYAQKAVLRIKEEAENAETGVVDMMRIWGSMSADVMSQLCFGEAFNLLNLGDKNDYMEALEACAIGMPLRQELPWLAFLIKFIPLTYFQRISNALEEAMKLMEICCIRSRGSKADTVFGGSKDYWTNEEKAEAAGFVLAGSDTTMVTLTYTIWAVLNNEDVRTSLEQELSGIEADDKALRGCLLLDCVIQEGLRLYGGIPTSLLRTVPRSGLFIGDYFLPEGTVVSASSYSLNRDGSIWKNPDKFLPSRHKHPPQGQHRQDLTFGGGGRNCIGQELAKREIGIAIALFFQQCKVAEVVTSEEMMTMKDFFVLVPKGGKCEIRLPAV